jgi:hypothetical protein
LLGEGIVAGAFATGGVAASVNAPASVAFWDASGHRRVIEYLTTTALPTAALNANNGTAPPAFAMAATSKDGATRINFGSGAVGGLAAGEQLFITFNHPYVNIPMADVSANNSATALKTPYISSVTTLGVGVGLAVIPATSQPGGTYDVTVTVTAD